MDSFLENAARIGAAYGLKVLGGIVILIVGFALAAWLSRLAGGLLRRVPRIDATLAGFFASLVRYLIVIFTILAVLGQFGIETTSIIALLGAAGLAIGLALQGTLANIAAGVMLLLFRPYRIGDHVLAGDAEGVVRELNLFTTELTTPDNVHIIVPNGKVWGTTIKNFSEYPSRAVIVTLPLKYYDQLDRVTEVLKAALADESRVLEEPPPRIVVSELLETYLKLNIVAWCATADYAVLRDDLLRAAKDAVDRARIKPPA